MTTRAARGETNHHAGLAAEDCVIRAYRGRGYELAARRWRGSSGEVDLVMRHTDCGPDGRLVFVEVKKSSTFQRALARVSPRQVQRIIATATEFLGSQPLGLLTECRFDLAGVNAAGQVRVLPNAFCEG